MAMASGVKQATPACWAMLEAQMNRFCASFSMARTMFSGTTSQPRRQPVMLKYLEKLLITMMSSPSDSAENGASS